MIDGHNGLNAMSRRGFMQCAVCAAAGSTLAGLSIADAAQSPGRGQEVLREFPYGAVRLSGGPNNRENDAENEGEDVVGDFRLVDALAQALAAQKVAAPPITVQHLASIPKSATGKSPLIRAYMAGPQADIPAKPAGLTEAVTRR